MKINKAQNEDVVNILAIAPGSTFEYQGTDFMRTVPLEVGIVQGTEALRNIVGVALNTGMYITVPSLDIDAKPILVTATSSEISIKPIPELAS